MNVDITGRGYEVSPAVRKQVEQGVSKLAKLLGNNFEAKVILSVEKFRCKAEVALTSRLRGQIVGAATATDMAMAVDGALDKTEKQAIKNKARWRNLKRQPKEKVWPEAAEPLSGKAIAVGVGASAATAVPVAVHSFPNIPKTTVAHLVRSDDAIAMRPMKLEEAIKECEFRDRDVFVFRDPKNNVKILHRRKDGKLELIEVP